MAPLRDYAEPGRPSALRHEARVAIGGYPAEITAMDDVGVTFARSTNPSLMAT
jgi:hypothetical protein